MKKTFLILLILPAMAFAQTRHSGNGEDYIKNFVIDGTNFAMDKKFNSSDAVFLRPVESKTKYELEIYSFSPRTVNYDVTYSLCYYKKVLFLVYVNYTTTSEQGTEVIQNMVSTIKKRLGENNFTVSDAQLAWKYGNYVALMNEISSTNKAITLMNYGIGEKLMSAIPSLYALKNSR